MNNRTAFSDPEQLPAAWPQRLIVQPRSQQVVGVVVPLLRGAAPLAATFDPLRRQRLFPDWDASKLVDVAIDTFGVFRWLHERGVVHGDGSANNVMVSREGRVGLIDCDGSQLSIGITTLTCGVTTPDYCPPELQPKTPAELEAFVRTPAQDTFSAAILVWQVLSAGGAHLYSGKWDKSDGSRPLSTEMRIEQNAWHGAQVGPYVGRVASPAKSLPLDAYGPRLVELTRRTFDDGWADPSARPTLQEWIDGLRKIRRALVPCVANPRHFYVRQRRMCPYCQVKYATGIDLFPRPPRNGLRLKTDSGWTTT